MGASLREEGKRAYILYDGEEEQLLYDFGLERGESVDVGQHGEHHVVTVLDVDTVYLYDGKNKGYARRLQISDEQIRNSNYSRPAYWIEGLGSDLGLLSPYGWGDESLLYRFSMAGNWPEFSYSEFFQVRPSDFSFVNDEPLWHIEQTIKENGKEIYRTVWFYIPDANVSKNGKTYKPLYYGIFSSSSDPLASPETIPATFLFGIREAGGHVYVDLEEYKESLARTGLGNPDNLPYEVTDDGELVLYDFNLQEGDRFGNGDVVVSSVEQTLFNRRVFRLSNGITFSERVGAVGSAGMLIAYMNPSDADISDIYFAAYGKKGVYISYKPTAGSGCFVIAPDIPTSIELMNSKCSTGSTTLTDLQGRHVQNNKTLPRGIYIQNGRKFVVK